MDEDPRDRVERETQHTRFTVTSALSRVIAAVFVAYGLFAGLSVPQQPNAADTLLVVAGSMVLLSVGYLLYCKHEWGWYASVLLLGVGTADTLLQVPGSGLRAAAGAALGVLALSVLYNDADRFEVGSLARET